MEDEREKEAAIELRRKYVKIFLEFPCL